VHLVALHERRDLRGTNLLQVHVNIIMWRIKYTEHPTKLKVFFAVLELALGCRRLLPVHPAE
jgi:hypothetical protein